MDGVNRALQKAAKLEEENHSTYDIYAAITTHIGLKRLLSGLMDAAKDHLQELEDFRRDNDPAVVFDATKAASIGRLEDADVEYAFDASMEYIDFLRMIYERETALAHVYDALAGAAADRDTEYFFRRLAEEGRKHAWLVRDRYELETLQ